MNDDLTTEERQRRASLAFKAWWESLLKRADQHQAVSTPGELPVHNDHRDAA